LIQCVQIGQTVMLSGPNCLAARNGSELIGSHHVLLLSERERDVVIRPVLFQRCPSLGQIQCGGTFSAKRNADAT
jgi:hypothetical protein